ncbi:TlpA disulfide reductase family protein [Flavihumibacter solisilvae]|uniref:TlpA disulfide reductase family protein n=1 Tax=Flavihumibacter solisilvae TaxID=1349421 RepID=UPI000690856F|nr:TlpA disulfide reductase family protein [Flavihumibacter solisilvae]
MNIKHIKIKLAAICVVVICALAAWKTPAADKFVITAEITAFTGDKVFLTYGTIGSSKIDTAIVKDGKFSFTGSVDEPTPAMIFSPDYRVRVDLFIENTKIHVTGTSMKPYSYVVTGTGVVAEFEKFSQRIMKNRQETITLFEEAEGAKIVGDTVKAAELKAKGDKQYRDEFAIRKEYAFAHPESYVAAKELLALTDNNSLAQSVQGYAKMAEKVKQSAIGRELKERIGLLSKVETGKPAQPFTQKNTTGTAVQLSDYRGKYVLLEFWASWCGPCRAENPNLVKMYSTYKDKGFEILSVSLDSDREKWLKAISVDGLPWMQVSDLKGWNNTVGVLYGVRAVPASFLVNPEGVIIAQGLRGEALEKKLEELLNRKG